MKYTMQAPVQSCQVDPFHMTPDEFVRHHETALAIITGRQFTGVQTAKAVLSSGNWIKGGARKSHIAVLSIPFVKFGIMLSARIYDEGCTYCLNSLVMDNSPYKCVGHPVDPFTLHWAQAQSSREKLLKRVKLLPYYIS